MGDLNKPTSTRTPGACEASAPLQSSLTPTEIRHMLLDNGYRPLPNRDKRCVLAGWPTVSVSHVVIDKWTARRDWEATGLRLDNFLAVIDLDVDHPVIGKILTALRTQLPALENAMVRQGRGEKVAIFVRTSLPFNRICSGKFEAPGGHGDTLIAEIFGGSSNRQFGSFGAHTKDYYGKVRVTYRWDNDVSPLNVRLRDLPILSPADFQTIANIADEVMTGEGFTLAAPPARNANTGRVYDLTPDMRFELNDGGTLGLSELKELAKYGKERCTASWLVPGATNPRRCLVGRSHAGHLTIFETASGMTHMETSLRPGGRLDEANAKLAALLRARTSGGGHHV
jgi:hypothetical protein